MTVTAKEINAPIPAEERDFNTCHDCVNLKGGTCAFRLNSPDYPSATVHLNDMACDAFNVPSTRIEHKPTPIFHSLPGEWSDVFYDTVATHDYRKTLSLCVLTVPDLRALGIEDQHYPVLAATCEHNGETCVFFMPNTKHVKVPYGELTDVQQFSKDDVKTVKGQRTRSIAVNRYDMVSLFTKVSEKGTVKLQHWRRVQFDQ